MNWLRRIIYLTLGTLLATLVVFGAATFAQDDNGAETPEAEREETFDNENDAESIVPGRWSEDHDEYLAEALDISVGELQAAYEEVRIAAIEQAVEEGILTEGQAEALLEGTGRFRGRFGPGFRLSGLDEKTLLAEAVGISPEELQAALFDARTARLDAMIEAGILTQEQADLMAAREAVEDYVDQEAIATMIKVAYESAVAEAVEDGAITQEQADQLLENLDIPGRLEFFDGSFHGHGPRGHHGFRGSAGGTFFDNGNGGPIIDAPADA